MNLNVYTDFILARVNHFLHKSSDMGQTKGQSEAVEGPSMYTEADCVFAGASIGKIKVKKVN